MYVRKIVMEMNFKLEELETKASLATCNLNKTFSDGFLVFYYHIFYLYFHISILYDKFDLTIVMNTFLYFYYMYIFIIEN